jgi:hypothetical protein
VKHTIKVFHHENGSREHWLLAHADGTLTFHEENAGGRFLDHGPEATTEQLTEAEATARWPWRASVIAAALAKAELIALVERFETAAYEVESASADLALLQADLQRLRPVLEGCGISLRAGAG